MTTTTKSGIILPEQSAPAGYAKFTDLDGRPRLIAVAFIVAVTVDEDEDVGIYTTTHEGEFFVRESFETVVERIKEAQ